MAYCYKTVLVLLKRHPAYTSMVIMPIVAIKFIKKSVTMLSVVALSVVMLNVVSP
jgi:hypothetical protein